MRKIAMTAFMVIITALISTDALAANWHKNLIGGKVCKTDEVQSSGAIYRICMPDSEAWNGDLVIFAHGFIPYNTPLHIPEDQLLLKDGSYMPERINDLGYAFAVTSYSTNGLAVKEGINDLCELVDIFSREYGQPHLVYLLGVSEGALITVLSLEQFPEIFDGGLAIGGMIGDYQKHTDYILNFRVIFDYFFPDLIPGNAVEIPKEVIDNWSTVYIPKIREAVRANQSETSQLLRVSDIPIDNQDPASIDKSITSLLWMNVVSTNNKIEKLGGQPFDNTNSYYHGSHNDLLLNKKIERFRADQSAGDEIERYYQTSGRLHRPLITLHNTQDPLVHYSQGSLYQVKTLKRFSHEQHVSMPISRYGHCNVKVDEIKKAFDLLVVKVIDENR